MRSATTENARAVRDEIQRLRLELVALRTDRDAQARAGSGHRDRAIHKAKRMDQHMRASKARRLKLEAALDEARVSTIVALGNNLVLQTKLSAVARYLDDMDNGTTHWEGCEDTHPRCKLRRQLEEQ